MAPLHPLSSVNLIPGQKPKVRVETNGIGRALGQRVIFVSTLCQRMTDKIKMVLGLNGF